LVVIKVPKDLEPIEHIFYAEAPRERNFAASIPSMLIRFIFKVRVHHGLIQNLSFSHRERY